MLIKDHTLCINELCDKREYHFCSEDFFFSFIKVQLYQENSFKRVFKPKKLKKTQNNKTN